MEDEKLLHKIEQDLKGILSEKRFKHSIGVMKKAGELAIKYDVDIYTAKVVGLAHDIAKEISKEDKIEYVKKYNIQIDEIEKDNIQLLHGKVGADICKRKYNFSVEMQNAICYHTTGNPDMDDLAKIIFIADKTEEGRKIDLEEVEKLEQMNINEQLVYLIDNSIKYTINKGKKIHPNSIYTRNKFL